MFAMRGKALALGAFALGACANTAPTRVDLALLGDSSLDLDAIELRIDGTVIETGVEPELELQVDDSTGGHPILVEVWGMKGGSEVAYGQNNVIPIAHDELFAAVTLAAVDCTTGDCTNMPPPTCTCDTAPADTCSSSSTAQVSIGTCDAAGDCHYTTTEQQCAAGCSDAACRQWTAIATSEDAGCALRSDGTMACWGKPGAATTTPPDGTFIALAGNYYALCAVTTGHAIKCWGDDSSMQLDAPIGSFTAVAMSQTAACAIRTDKSVACWGQIVNDTDETPFPSPDDGAFIAISVGTDHACGITTDHTVTCWGDSFGDEGTPPTDEVTDLAVGSDFACALLDAGTITCWGNQSYPSGSLEGNIEWSTPSGTFEHVYAGDSWLVGQKSDGTLHAYGALSTEGSGHYGPVAVSAAVSFACGITTAGPLACWGDGTDGELDPP